MPHGEEVLSMLADTAPLVAVVLGASPYSYTAPDAGVMVVQGGTVAVIELGRKGLLVTTGQTFGTVAMCKGDVLRVTYSVVPSMTFFKG